MAEGGYTKVCSVNEKWRLASDRCQWTLQKLVKTELKPDGVWTATGFYPTITMALGKLCNEEEKMAGTLQGVIKKVEELEELLINLNLDEKVEK